MQKHNVELLHSKLILICIYSTKFKDNINFKLKLLNSTELRNLTLPFPPANNGQLMH